MSKTILTYGTYDMFHIGHLKLLKRLKSLGDKLIVAVSTDEFNEIKGKKTIIPYEQRAEIVEAIKYVDMVIPENNWEQKVTDIKKYNVDIFSMGHDWEGKFDELKEYCEVVYLPRTEGISTTVLKEQLKQISEINIYDINKAFEILQRLKSDFE
ncbi:MAG TPA: glycerol-3-phosphate cytidylyltransferase [Campylobacterales bacterium]|nr:glycerol-3-phosphate cytidylyltransferase [Campylobacterales bacterium]